MMYNVLALMIALPFALSGAQWQSLNGPPAGRADDMSIGKYGTGWVIYAADNTHKLYKSTNEGELWLNIEDAVIIEPVCVISRPNNAQIVYIGRNSSTPVWWSEDGGDNWDDRSGSDTARITNTSPRCFTMDPNNPIVLYLGCKRYDDETPEMFKTINAGADWQTLSDFPDITINDIAICNTTVLAACSGAVTVNGIWFSVNDTDWVHKLDSTDIYSVDFANQDTVYAGSSDGIYKSTDGGDNWSKLVNSPSYRINSLAAINPDTVCAGTQEDGMYLTTNGGADWNKISGDCLCDTVLCVLVHPESNQTLFSGAHWAVYKTTNGGSNWSEITKGYLPAELIDVTTNLPTMYALGDDLYKSGLSSSMFRSNDGANNWLTLTGCYPYHPHSNALVSTSPVFTHIVLFGGTMVTGESENWAFIHRSSDSGETWQPVYQTQEEENYVRAIEFCPIQDTVVFAGLWAKAPLIRSLDAGLNWDTLTGLPPGSGVQSLCINPKDDDVVYAGTYVCGVQKSTDLGESWSQTELDSVQVNALAIDCDYSDIVYAGSKNPNGIYKTVDGGSHWFKANNGLGSHRYIQDIEIDSDEPTIAYTLCKQNILANQSYVYCSVDRGSKWFDVSAGLPLDKRIHDLEIDYDEPDTVFVATENGIYTYTPDFDKSRVSSSDKATSYNNGKKMVRVDSTIWVCYESGGMVHSIRSTDLGQTWSKKMELGTGEIPAIACPQDAALWHPEVGVAWISHGASQDTVYYRQYVSDTLENTIVVYATDGTVGPPSITITNNQVFVIFDEIPAAPNGEYLVCARFVPGITAIVDTLDSGDWINNASVDYLKDNTTVNAAWEKNSQIYLTYYDGDWNQSIEQVGFSDSTNAQVSIEAINGRAYVVWSAKAPSGGHYNVYWRYKSYNGTPSWSSTYLVSRNSTSDCGYPSLTDGIYCSYTQNNEIYSNCFDSIAGNWGSAPINVSNTGQRSIYSHITRHQINDDTYIYYLWTEKDSVPYDIEFSSYKIRFPVAPDIMANKQSNDAVIAWHPVTTDIYGNPITCDHYTTYRDTSFDFVPSSDNLFASGSDTAITDTNALLSSDNYNYLTFSHSTYGTQSTKSNMGYVFHRPINENPGETADRNWVSLPWQGEYATCSLLCVDLSPNAEVFNKVTHLVDTTQAQFSYFWHDSLGRWLGTNFAILLGHFYEFNAVKDTTLVLVGANFPDSSRFLNENPGISDRNWVGLPYNAAYSTASDITDEIALDGSPINKVTHLVDSTQMYFSYFYHAGLGRWLGTNFAIEPGHGYEFVATKDSTWNPTEWSNEEQGLFIVTPPTQKLYVNMYVGTSSEPTRAPVWVIDKGDDKKVQKEFKKNIDHCCAYLYRPVIATPKSTIDHRKDNIYILDSETYTGEGAGEPRDSLEDERRISHLVWTHLHAQGFENIVFTTYRLNDPHDVLTEKSTGSVLASNAGASYHLINNDVGNFKNPWKHGEEVVLIIEATKEGKPYYDVIDYKLDDKVDIQVLRDVEFKPYPKLVSGADGLYWNATDSDNIVGYSLYQNGERLNERVLTQKHYRAEADVNVKLVIKGGHETVYGSQGIQSSPEESIPISYAFNISPNPFIKQTRIDYALPKQTSVDIVIYDVSGRKIKTLASEMQSPGYYSTTWTGIDDKVRTVSSGVYFVRFKAGEFSIQEKILLVR